MATKKVVHIIGTGTIGEPLIGLFTDRKDLLGFDEVTFHKRTPLLTDRSKVVNLLKRGARLACDESARRGFREIGIEPAYEHHEALRQATVVIDCTPSDVGLQNKKEIYEKYAHSTLGFIAQGSEFGFGKPFVHGISDRTLQHGQDQFIQVLSCNTHNLSVLIDQIARVSDVRGGDFDGDGDLDLAVAQFGYDDGQTRWMENLGNWRSVIVELARRRPRSRGRISSSNHWRASLFVSKPDLKRRCPPCSHQRMP